MDFNWILNMPIQNQAIQKADVPLIGMNVVLRVRVGVMGQEMKLACNSRIIVHITVSKLYLALPRAIT